jgi:hypothetical protein
VTAARLALVRAYCVPERTIERLSIHAAFLLRREWPSISRRPF